MPVITQQRLSAKKHCEIPAIPCKQELTGLHRLNNGIIGETLCRYVTPGRKHVLVMKQIRKKAEDLVEEPVMALL